MSIETLLGLTVSYLLYTLAYFARREKKKK